ncbi:hypothetical protein GB937_002245 [Aspergillus fischeri]|nr:hypothetical protein GB937_002245 [Aspergillus fischeri]
MTMQRQFWILEDMAELLSSIRRLDLGRRGKETHESKTKTRITAPTGIPSSKVLKVEKPKP